MQGILVTNHYVHSEKFEQLFGMLEDAARRAGVGLSRRSNFELELDRSLARGADFILFWDKDVRLARLLEQDGHRLYNSAAAIERCDDKSRAYAAAAAAGLRCPKTILAPKLYHALDWDRVPELGRIEAQLGYPMVVKECYGSFGKQVFLARDRAELIAICAQMDTRPFLFQQFIAESSGRDIRVNVVGGRIVAAMVRRNEQGDFRANVAKGARCTAYTPSDAEARMALAAAAALGLDFGGIDILFGVDGPVFCEANSNLHFRGIYECTGVNTADHILAHIASAAR